MKMEKEAISKQGYKELPVDMETYRRLEVKAKGSGLTVDEYVAELVRELVETPIDKIFKRGVRDYVSLTIAIRKEVVELYRAWMKLSRMDISIEGLIERHIYEGLKADLEACKPHWLPDGPSIAKQYGVKCGVYADC